MVEALLCDNNNLLQSLLVFHLDIEDSLVADRHSLSLVADVGNLELVGRALDFHREVTVDVGLRCRDDTVVGITLGDITHHHRSIRSHDGTRYTYSLS